MLVILDMDYSVSYGCCGGDTVTVSEVTVVCGIDTEVEYNRLQREFNTFLKVAENLRKARKLKKTHANHMLMMKELGYPETIDIFWLTKGITFNKTQFMEC